MRAFALAFAYNALSAIAAWHTDVAALTAFADYTPVTFDANLTIRAGGAVIAAASHTKIRIFVTIIPYRVYPYGDEIKVYIDVSGWIIRITLVDGHLQGRASFRKRN